MSNSNWINISTKLSHSDYKNCNLTVKFPGTDNVYSIELPVFPEDVTNSISTNYTSYDILGRPGQISVYNSTGDMTTSFTLHMHRELQTSESTLDNTYLADINQIDKIVSLIEASQYPIIDSTSAGEYVPIVTYRFGDTVITGKQTSVNTKWSGPKIEGKYMEVVISISVTCTAGKIKDFTDIFNSNPRGNNRWT